MPNCQDARSTIENALRLATTGSVGEARKALEPLTEFLAEGAQGDRDFWRDAATALRDAGLYDAARAAWHRAAQAGLADYVARSETALVDLFEGRFDEALEALDVLRQTYPNNAPLADLYALALFECGRREEALEAWEKCLAVSAQTTCPVSSTPIHLALAAAALERFDAETATEETPQADGQTDAVRAPGRTAAARRRRIEKAIEQERFDLALSWMDAETTRGVAQNPEMALLRALALGEMGRYREAVRVLCEPLSDDEKSPPVQAYLGYCLARAGAPDIALAVLESVWPEGPDDYFAYYFRGVAHLAAGDRASALRGFRVAFSDYFFDNYWCVFVPLWERAAKRIKAPSQTPR